VIVGARRTQAERTQATVDEIVATARELFAANGYDPTFLESVVECAGMTKGALYHHFSSKREVFAAVFEAEQVSIEHAVKRAVRGSPDSWEVLLRGCRGFFKAVLDPGVQRITLIDAPAVLGWEEMREVEDRHGTALLRQGLAQAMKDGHIKSQRVEPLAHLIHGAMCEAAMTVARSSNPRREARDALAALNDMLNGIAQRE